jgi:hypothetical protein
MNFFNFQGWLSRALGSARRRPVLTVAQVPALMSQFIRTRDAPDPGMLKITDRRHRVLWKCPRGPDHVWRQTAASRGGVMPRAGDETPAADQFGGKISSPRTTDTGTDTAPVIDDDGEEDDGRGGGGGGGGTAAERIKQPPTEPDMVDSSSSTATSNPKPLPWRRLRPVTDPDFAPLGCPFCAGRRLSVTNRLDAVCPPVAAEWDPVRNVDSAGRPIPASHVTAASHKRAHWICEHGHPFMARVDSRTEGLRGVGDPQSRYSTSSTARRGRGCPVCANRRAVDDTIFPGSGPLHNLVPPRRRGRTAGAQDDDDNDNDNDNDDAPNGHAVTASSGIISKSSLASAHPALAREWHPDPARNGGRTPSDVSQETGGLAWWRCARGHEWQAGIERRVVGGGACQKCAALGLRRTKGSQGK